MGLVPARIRRVLGARSSPDICEPTCYGCCDSTPYRVVVAVDRDLVCNECVFILTARVTYDVRRSGSDKETVPEIRSTIVPITDYPPRRY